MGEMLVSVQGLGRSYGRRVAVRDLDFTLARGEVLGLLGPNGAGKSTTLNMLAGVIEPSAGRVAVDGRVGYLPERPPLYPDLTVDEYLDYVAGLQRVPRAARRGARERVKSRCGLEADGHRLLGNLSHGYRQRAGIAQAIIHEPDVLILDEPTVGLDPNQVRAVRALVAELGRGCGVILSTHILSEVEANCGSVHILHRGRSVFHGPVAALERPLELIFAELTA